MKRFGYLEVSSTEGDGVRGNFSTTSSEIASGGPAGAALYAPNQIIDGIQSMQKFAGLPMTGILDEPTVRAREPFDIIFQCTWLTNDNSFLC